MLSSLGLDKNSFRNPRSRASKTASEPPTRGLSVHVFKNPPPASRPYSASGKLDYVPSYPQDSAIWSRQPSYQSRPSSDRKLSSSSNDFHIMNTLTYSQPTSQKPPKSSNGYGIYPSAVGDIYICERSISSTSDLLGSPSSSSSDSDSYRDHLGASATEISSIRARSSTETLETTALAVQRTYSASRGGTAFAPPKTSESLTSVPTRPDGVGTVNSLLGRGDVTSKRPGATVPTSTIPIRLTPPGVVVSDSDSDSDTIVSDTLPDDPILNMLGARRPSVNAAESGRRDTRPPVPPTTARRDSDERAPQAPRMRETVEMQRSISSSQMAPRSRDRQDPRMENASLPRAPPGLATSASSSAASQQPRRSSSPVQVKGTARPATAPPQPTRSGLERDVRPPLAPTSGSYTARSAESGVPPSAASYSAPPMQRTLTASSRRCVRWTENLVCTSLPPSERRKGWFNCRGDQLWTNDGRYKSPENGTEYPPELAGYPEPNTGWMNEEGTRIDIEHRLVPKPPLRSVLKKPRSL